MKDNFSDKAKIWDENPLRVETADIFFREIQKNINISSDFNMLDFGSGTGLVGLNFSSLVHSLVMIDTSEAMLSVLKEKIISKSITNINIVHGDITKLALKESTFDVIFSLMAFHHINNIPEVLKAFHAILKNNGYAIIGDLVKEDGSFHGEEEVEHNGFDLEKIKDTFNSNNLSVKKIYTYNKIKKPDLKGIMKEYEQFILISQKI